MTIDFVTDFVCPYCLVAKEALEQVIDDLRLKDVEVVCHPLELTPPEKDPVDTWNDAVRRERYQVLETPARYLGLADMKLPPHVVPRPRTRLAWEAWLFMKERGLGHLWEKCVYRAYFIHEEDIGDPELLLRYARVLGQDAELLRQCWQEGRYTGELVRMEKEARERFDPHGVPTIVCGEHRFSLSTYSRNEMEAQLRLALGLETEEDVSGEEEGPVCGPDGCE